MKGQGRKQDINLNFKVIFGNIEESRGELVVGDISNMKIKIFSFCSQEKVGQGKIEIPCTGRNRNIDR